MQHIDNFCSFPNIQDFRRFDTKIQDMLHKISLFSIKENMGEVDLAKRIVKWYKLRNITDNSLSGLMSLFSGMRLLRVKEFVKIKKGIYPNLSVYLTPSSKKAVESTKKSPSFVISFGKIKDMFIINQTNKKFGVDKELALYYDGAKEYFVDLFIDHPEIEISQIIVNFTSDLNKEFYQLEIGIVWGNEDCIECKETKSKSKSKHCNKLLVVEKCYDKIKNKPSDSKRSSKKNKIVYSEIEKVKPDKVKNIFNVQTSDWECSSCLLQNKETVSKCIACEQPRE